MAKPDRKIEMLKGVPALRGMNDKQLRRIAQLVDEIKIESGEVLTRQGDMARECFVVVDGTAEVVIDDHAVNKVGPGDFVGEMGMLEVKPRNATVRALTPMYVLVADPRSFASLVEEPSVARAMLKGLADRLRQAEGSPTQ